MIKASSIVAALVLSAASSVFASPYILTGAPFTKDFTPGETVSPAGFEQYTGASATAMGGAASISSASAASTTGNFRFLSDGTGGWAIRQSGNFGDPGAAFVFRIANTTGYEDFTIAFNAGNFSNQTRTTSWTVQYGLGATPSSFTTLGTISSDESVSNHSYSLPDEVENFGDNVVFRVVALSASTGSGSRDTFGLDNISLTYSAIPEPAALGAFGLASLLIARRRR